MNNSEIRDSNPQTRRTFGLQVDGWVNEGVGKDPQRGGAVESPCRQRVRHEIA